MSSVSSVMSLSMSSVIGKCRLLLVSTRVTVHRPYACPCLIYIAHLVGIAVSEVGSSEVLEVRR